MGVTYYDPFRDIEFEFDQKSMTESGEKILNERSECSICSDTADTIKKLLFKNCLIFGTALACKQQHIHTNSTYTLGQLEVLHAELTKMLVDAKLWDEYSAWVKKRIESFFAKEEEEC